MTLLKQLGRAFETPTARKHLPGRRSVFRGNTVESLARIGHRENDRLLRRA